MLENKELRDQLTDVRTQLQRSRALARLPEKENLAQVTQETVPVSTKQDHGETPCIFEVREAGRCFRREKCTFNHNFDPRLRDNAQAVQKLIDDTSRNIKKCAVEMVDGKCPHINNNCPYPHKSQCGAKASVPRGTRVCFRELMEKGSCRRGEQNKCKFSHKISEEQRNDPDFVDQMIREKDEKASKCINEFAEKGTCSKGAKCPFSHVISEQDRRDKELRRKMEERRSLALGRNTAPKSSTTTGSSSESDLAGMVLALMVEVKELVKQTSLNRRP